LKWQGIISSRAEYIELAPEDINSLMNRGKLFYEMGDHPKALTDITRTIELNPDFIYA